MLAASLPPQHTWYQKPLPPSQRRGRDRNVSAVAMARHASEERRRRDCQEEQELMRRRRRREQRRSSPSPAPRSISPTPPSSHSSSLSTTPSNDYYSRPPSPPRTLADRLQVAYAHDDIILAKTLYLQLKYNLQITSPSDPRLDSVQDEDFDEFFVPHGGLKLEEADKRMIEEGKRRQQALMDEQKRIERLRACERIWEKEKRKMREEKARVVRKREEEARAVETKKQERAHRERTQRPSWHRASDPGPSSSSRSEERAFEYAFMPTSITPPRKSILSKRESHIPSAASSPCSVPFKDVVSSMHGPLFPPSHTDQPARAQSELFNSLLKVVQWDEEERRRVKGKGADKPVTKSTSCAACCAATRSVPSTISSRNSIISISSTTSAGTALSRTSSWLSFGSSRASVSTAATTPATSPISTWLKSASPAPMEKSVPKQVLRHSCTSRLAPISISECPLNFVDARVPSPTDEFGTDSGAALALIGGGGKQSGLGRRMSLGVSSLVELAKGFQSVYMNAALFSVTVEQGYGYRDDSRSSSGSNSRSPVRRRVESGGKKALNPPGYRVLSVDVGVFTAPSLTTTTTAEPEAIHFIPLISPFPPPSTTIARSPSPSVKNPSQLIQPSPYRPRTPPQHLAYRMRPISNPVLLRLRALQNVLVERGKAWEGRGREGGLGCGRERMLGMAFEGRGRSGLGCEVRVGVV